MIPQFAIRAAGAAIVAILAVPASSQTLKTVRERGVLVCGVSQGVLGFSSAGENGAVIGFDADLCRGIAAATLGDASKVRYELLPATTRFASLTDGQIDVLVRNSTWTMGREVGLGVLFPAVTYYDGQGFLVPKSRNVTSALELDGVKVCVQAGTTTESNLTDFFTANGMEVEKVTVADADQALQKYTAGLCDVLTSDVSQLYGERLKLPKPAQHAVLPDIISKEPLGPAVRADDVQWFNVVRWVTYALINAEELGVNSRNMQDALNSQRPDVRRLLGKDGDFGIKLGLDQGWAANIVRSVGNYGEVYERNVGSQSRLGIPRGLNQLWQLGGILYAPPVR